ncbi:rod shape-determining protein MreC [Caldanaerobius polysaccharolyticus]|uniref:rod shape-determining protein MreC n=1 Tax=Caldanaerobius polysaccharolyticus TaxID=44256 RepID=UPI000479A472|nr:rod shape-determining protein MreC [Caldanaerobius polysaccharolyticus]
MPRFLKYRKAIFLTIVILMLVILSAKTYNAPYVNKVGNYISFIVRPTQRVLYAVSQYVNDVFASIAEIGSLKKENIALKNEVLKLRKENLRLAELTIENKQLKDMLNFKKQNPDIKLVGANIVAINSLDTFDSLIIDVGKSDGVKPGMAVITSEGLVGKVTQVADKWCKVLTILDQTSAVSAIDVRTRDNGIIHGNEENNGMLTMEYIPVDSQMKAGDDIVTSGLGGVFPKGLYVGKVQNVTKSTGSLMKIAKVKPAADFKRLEYVYVVLSNSLNINFK